MPGLLDTFKQKATAVKDYLYPPAPNGMTWWDYAQFKANDPLQPNLSSQMMQQDLINKGLNLAGLAPVGMVNKLPKGLLYDAGEWVSGIGPQGTTKKLAQYKKGNDVVAKINVYKYPDGSLDLTDIVVSPELQGKGIATDMFNKVLNETGASGMYNSIGFTGDGLKWAEKLGLTKKPGFKHDINFEKKQWEAKPFDSMFFIPKQ